MAAEFERVRTAVIDCLDSECCRHRVALTLFTNLELDVGWYGAVAGVVALEVVDEIFCSNGIRQELYILSVSAGIDGGTNISCLPAEMVQNSTFS